MIVFSGFWKDEQGQDLSSTPCSWVLWRWRRLLSSSSPAAASRVSGRLVRASSLTPIHSRASCHVRTGSLARRADDKAGPPGGVRRRALWRSRRIPEGGSNLAGRFFDGLSHEVREPGPDVPYGRNGKFEMNRDSLGVLIFAFVVGIRRQPVAVPGAHQAPARQQHRGGSRDHPDRGGGQEPRGGCGNQTEDVKMADWTGTVPVGAIMKTDGRTARLAGAS